MLAISALLVTSACGESLDSGANQGDVSSEEGKEGWPETIVYGLLPTEDMKELVAQYEPLEEYMAECLDHRFEILPGTDYTAMIEAMRSGSAHIVKLGPFAYILANNRAGAEPLAVALEGGSEPVYRSWIITRRSNGYQALDDLEGKSFAFVDPASASGHLFPRAMIMDEVGIDSDEIEDWFGDVVYAGNHEAALIAVLNGDADAGAIASSGSHITHENGEWSLVPGNPYGDHPNADDFLVLAESDDIPNTVEAVQEDLPDSLKQAVLSCYQGVADAPSLSGFRKELSGGSGYGFAAAEDGDYDPIREVAAALGMSPEELLSQ